MTNIHKGWESLSSRVQGLWRFSSLRRFCNMIRITIMGLSQKSFTRCLWITCATLQWGGILYWLTKTVTWWNPKFKSHLQTKQYINRIQDFLNSLSSQKLRSRHNGSEEEDDNSTTVHASRLFEGSSLLTRVTSNGKPIAIQARETRQ